MRQLIKARKDLQMSPGKLAAQVSPASMAFLTNEIRSNAQPVWKYKTMPAVKTDSLTGEKGDHPYKRGDLSAFSRQAYEAGHATFTVRPVDPGNPLGKLELCENEIVAYSSAITINKDVYEQWFCAIFTKTICEAKNRNQLMKAAELATQQGLQEGKDFFLIKDNCLTELEPEEIDENGVGRTLTCIGFRPLPDDVAHAISRKFQLYR